MARILNVSKGTVVAEDVAVARSFWGRFRGLMLRRGMASGEALLIEPSASSHTAFMRFPIDVVKIDRSFVRDLTSDPSDAAIAKAIITMAHALDLTVVAEGVENKEAWDRLAALGCDMAQGYYMSRPLPEGELISWLDQSPWGLENKCEK